MLDVIIGLEKIYKGLFLSHYRMEKAYSELTDRSIEICRKRDGLVMIGIAGSPGSGKSTTSLEVCRRLNHLGYPSIVVPMDGYHFSKSELSKMDNPEEAFNRRGAHWTFDSYRFVQDLQNLRSSNSGILLFPSFDHGTGDPKEDDIMVDLDVLKIILIEGNYLFLDLEPWRQISELLDDRWFIDCELEMIRQRVFKRHLKSGDSEERAKFRVEYNDVPNARLIQETKSKALLITDSVNEDI